MEKENVERLLTAWQVMIDASKLAFKKYGVTDRVKLIEGPADESIEQLTGTFDIVFVDANKDGYLGYVKQILGKRLLSDNGVIICDNGRSCSFYSVLIFSKSKTEFADHFSTVLVFARGLTIGKDVSPSLSNAVRPYWTACGAALAQFNDFMVKDDRVDVTVLPLFDGISQIKWKSAPHRQNNSSQNGSSQNGSSLNGSAQNGNSLNGNSHH